jgi:opacity protein-like surface antigen
VIRSVLLALIVVLAPLAAQAQGSNPGAEHKWSVGTGIGFGSSIGSGPFSQSGFLWQLDGQYRVTDPLSVGLYLQVVPVDGGTIFTFAADGRYHFDLSSQSNDFVSRLSPYLGFGFGLAHAGSDFSNASDNGALFAFIAGIEYDINDHVALASDMRFNLVAGNDTNDTFFYTWQIVGARYRF